MITSNLQDTRTRRGKRKLRGHRSHSARVYISRQENRRPDSTHVLFEGANFPQESAIEKSGNEMWQISDKDRRIALLSYKSSRIRDGRNAYLS